MNIDNMQYELKQIMFNCKAELEETLNNKLIGKKLYQVKTDRHGEAYKPIYKGIISDVTVRDLNKYCNPSITLNTKREAKEISTDTYLNEISDSRQYGFYIED